MAYDISLDEAPQHDAPPPATFEEFYDLHADALGRALSLACDDADLAEQGLAAALVKASQRWKQLSGHPNPMGWTLYEGLTWADKTLRERPPLELNAATGGYVRGLELVDALASLPLQQRAGLVVAYYLKWDDAQAAAGFDGPATTITTRRTRGLTFLAHHLREPAEEVESLLISHFAAGGSERPVAAPDMPDVRRRGRRRTLRNRLAAVALVASVIAVGGALLQADPPSPPAPVGPEPVAAPNSSSDWFDPVSNGRGGFVALNTRGSSRFALSTDGVNWFAAAEWNSRAVDLRTEVTSFRRTGFGYVTTIEPAPAIRSFVAPFVAVSDDLQDWDVRQVDIEPPPEVGGVRVRYEVRDVAVDGELVLVAIGIEESLDYQFHSVRPTEVCAESADQEQLTFFLCDGDTLLVDRPQTGITEQTRYLLAEGKDRFIEVELPGTPDPRSISATGTGFAVVDSVTGQVSTSIDGRSWTPVLETSAANRLLLLESDGLGQSVAVIPAATGWTSSVLAGNRVIGLGKLPIQIDPAVVWSQPELAAGPAGWALFITTSRPWERADITPGWAIDTGDWIVSRQPDTDLITASSFDGAQTFRYIATSEWVEVRADGTIALLEPGTSEVLVEITQAAIEASRTIDDRQTGVKAQVFFSADGTDWRQIWESDRDAWFGSLSVGDDEVLLSGTRLSGPPIRIPIPE